MSKATKAEKESRIDEVVDLLCQGIRPHKIGKILIEEKNWNIGMRQVRNYIKWARNYFVEQSKLHRDEMLGKALERLNELYLKANEKKDYRTALMVQKELNELAELKKVILDGDLNTTVTIHRVISDQFGKTIKLEDHSVKQN